jgi:hypothetical protein
MDQQKLRNLVFEKTGVRIDVDDPVFALVALNEAVLEEAVERHIALLHEASSQITGLPGPASASTRTVPAARQSPALLAGGAAVLAALLVLIGQALLFRPVPAQVAAQVPAQAPAQAALSAQQIAALQAAEKLNRVVERLDRKTRTAIAAEMAKP